MQTLPPNVEIFVTQDGSPTLIWRNRDGSSEKMHHSGGALGESFYIYHQTLRETLARGWPIRILSLGLGLAYNELIAVGELQRAKRDDWKLWSFESEDFLRQFFTGWLNGEGSPLDHVYQQIATAVATRLELKAQELINATRAALRDGRLELRGPFPEQALKLEPLTCVFYDAFSKKMNPELWDELELVNQLGPLLAKICVFSTYAATGSLNRAIKTLGFSLRPKPGFLGKRESTLAIRE